MVRRCLTIVVLHLALGGTVPPNPAGAAPPGQPAIASEPVLRRPDVVRMLTNGDPAIQQALTLLGQPINPVRVAGPELIRRLYARTPGAGEPPRGLRAFRAGDRGDPFIYVARRSPEYTRVAARGTALAVLALAGTLVHEQVHNTDGGHAAARLEADFVRSRLGQVPRHEWAATRLYLDQLEMRAQAFERVARRLNAERWLRSATAGHRVDVRSPAR